MDFFRSTMGADCNVPVKENGNFVRKSVGLRAKVVCRRVMVMLLMSTNMIFHIVKTPDNMFFGIKKIFEFDGQDVLCKGAVDWHAHQDMLCNAKEIEEASRSVDLKNNYSLNAIR